MSCQVIIESSSGNFFPGGSIQGRVACVFHRGENTRGIRLKLRGREYTSWTKRESYYDSHAKQTKYRTVHYHGDNKFLESQITLANQGTLGPGRFEYPFNFTLPTNIPASFNTHHGSIRYYLKANVDIPWAPDYESEVTFTVVAPIDFNTMPHLMMNPVQLQDEKNLCCCCCASGPITMDVYLEKEAFVLGETIKIKVHMLNMSNESINFLSAKLKMTIKEIATHPHHDSKTTEDLIAATSDTGVGAHGDRDYELPLVIPNSIVLPNFNGCTLFQKWCVLEIEAEIPGCHTNLSVETGITLGHVPLVAGAGMSQPIYVDGASYPTSPPAPYPPNDSAPPYPGGPGDFTAPQAPPLNEKEVPGVHMPMPMPMPMPTPGGPPYPPGFGSLPPYPSGISSPFPQGPSSTPYPPTSANAPPEEEAPSAPPKMPLDSGDDFEIIGGDSRSGQSSSREPPPPPSYFDAVDSKAVLPPPPPKQ